MRYRVMLSAEEPNTFIFPELGETITVETEEKGATTEQLGAGAFALALNKLRHEKKPIPLPTGEGESTVAFIIQLKIILWNWMLENRYRPMDLARLMHISSTQAYRILDARYSSDLDVMFRAFSVFGLDVTMTCEAK